MKQRSNAILFSAFMLFLLLLGSLIMMSDAAQNSARFAGLYSFLLLFNTLGLLGLVALISVNIHGLIRQFRDRRPGSRMTVRMVMMFTVLAVTPVLVVYYFSLDFLRRGIDSWFDVRIEQALGDSLELSRKALDVRRRELLKEAEHVAVEFTAVSDANAAIRANEIRDRIGAEEVTLFSRKGGIIASSISDSTKFVPNTPSETILLQVRQGTSYIGLDSIRDSGLHIRVVVNVPEQGMDTEPRVLQALFPVPERMSELADNVQLSYIKYKELAYLREQLKISFAMTLTLVLLFSIFSAVWAAFYSARRLAAPIRDLVEGTKAVAEGDYSTQLPVPSSDEMGFLVKSFNEMTRKIAHARDEATQSQEKAEAQRAYLEVVLGRLSSGVMALDQKKYLRTANMSASHILGLPVNSLLGHTLSEICAQHPYLQQFRDAIEPHLDASAADWREQVSLFGISGRQILMCSGTSLPGYTQGRTGHVIVFDDITALIQGQRDAAWSQMAQRLAHEIKNPLTPIQLAAERLRHKYLDTMDPEDSEVLDRLTHTIVQQVETMQDMVNTFSEYARTPQIRPEPLDLNRLIKEVLDLYGNVDPAAKLQVHLERDMPLIKADAGRLRQVLNNLLNNALEASDPESPPQLTISTRCSQEASLRFVELRVQDRGPGIPSKILDQIFEPYVTTKTKGTGLGLAIVKKIVEEHGGVVWLENNRPGPGACAIIRLLVTTEAGIADAPQVRKDAV
ncbi:MAG: ATP-binding protein [Gammaproteobacteria bacterium]|nr:ATP-binding protein [Gammaproteobacteria bacterium]MCI0590573.1 ATP-binding protein [Gammaproteobacteria bacterium]